MGPGQKSAQRGRLFVLVNPERSAHAQRDNLLTMAKGKKPDSVLELQRQARELGYIVKYRYGQVRLYQPIDAVTNVTGAKDFLRGVRRARRLPR